MSRRSNPRREAAIAAYQAQAERAVKLGYPERVSKAGFPRAYSAAEIETMEWLLRTGLDKAEMEKVLAALELARTALIDAALYAARHQVVHQELMNCASDYLALLDKRDTLAVRTGQQETER